MTIALYIDLFQANAFTTMETIPCGVVWSLGCTYAAKCGNCSYCITPPGLKMAIQFMGYEAF